MRTDWALRIAQSTPAQLVVVHFELIQDFLREALDAAEDETFAHYASKAKDGVEELMAGLNFSVPLAQDLYDIYVYIYKILTAAYFQYDRLPVREAVELTGLLLDGFRVAAEACDAEANTPKVYAGLTYQRDGLTEYVAQDDGRGYRA